MGLTSECETTATRTINVYKLSRDGHCEEKQDWPPRDVYKGSGWWRGNAMGLQALPPKIEREGGRRTSHSDGQHQTTFTSNRPIKMWWIVTLMKRFNFYSPQLCRLSWDVSLMTVFQLRKATHGFWFYLGQSCRRRGKCAPRRFVTETYQFSLIFSWTFCQTFW